MKLIQVWDKAIRFYHWSQALLFAGLWFSAEQGYLVVHQLMAYSLMALLAARLLWGFIGSDTARFNHFLQSPAQLLRMGLQAKHGVGHNGWSGYMSLLLMLLLTVQFVSGLMTSDDVLTEGPLVALVSSDWASFASWFHHNNFNLLLGLITVHLVAAASHALKKDGVLMAMVHGQQKSELAQPRIRAFGWYLVIVVIVLALFASWQGEVLYQQW